jgi:hypothetical protein
MRQKHYREIKKSINDPDKLSSTGNPFPVWFHFLLHPYNYHLLNCSCKKNYKTFAIFLGELSETAKKNICKKCYKAK